MKIVPSGRLRRMLHRISASYTLPGLTRHTNAVTGVLLVCIVLAVLLAQSGGYAQTVDALPYSGGYLVTGNYVAGFVDLTEQANPPDAQGMSTGTIPISNVPPEAEIVGAYLYFEAITPRGTGISWTSKTSPSSTTASRW